MSGGTGRLPGRDDARDPDCICFYSFYRLLFIWRRDVERDDFCHINASSHLARDNIVLTLRYLQ